MPPVASISTPESNLLVLAGDIDLHVSPRAREAVSKILENKPARVYVDLGGVTYMDSSGIAVLIETLQQTQAYGGKLAIYSVPPRVKAVFEVARLDQVLGIYPDAAAARNAG